MSKTIKSVGSYLGHAVTDPIKASVNPFDMEGWRTIAADATNTDPGEVVRNNAGDSAADTLHSVVSSVAPAVAGYFFGPLASAGLRTAFSYGDGGSLGSSLGTGAKSYATSVAGSALGSLASSAPSSSAGVFGGGTGGAASSYGGDIAGSYGDITDASLDGLSSGIGSSSSALGSGSTAGLGAFGNSAGDIASSTLNTGGNVASSTGSLLGNLSKYSPLLSAGLGAYTNLSAKNDLLDAEKANQKLLTPFLNQQFTPGDLTQDPGYQFQLQQGNQALDRQQAAKGNYFSGQALQEAQNLGQGLASTTYNDAFQRFLANQGQKLSAADALTGVNNDIGNTKAGSTTNLGNLFSSTAGSLLGGSAYGNQGQLLGQGSSGLSPELLALLTRQQSRV